MKARGTGIGAGVELTDEGGVDDGTTDDEGRDDDEVASSPGVSAMMSLTRSLLWNPPLNERSEDDAVSVPDSGGEVVVAVEKSGEANK